MSWTWPNTPNIDCSCALRTIYFCLKENTHMFLLDLIHLLYLVHFFLYPSIGRLHRMCRHFTHFCLHLVEEKKCSSGVNFDNSKEYLIYFGSRTNILLVGSISILTNHSSDTATLYLLGDHHHVHHLTFVSLLKPYLVPAYLWSSTLKL